MPLRGRASKSKPERGRRCRPRHRDDAERMHVDGDHRCRMDQAVAATGGQRKWHRRFHRCVQWWRCANRHHHHCRPEISRHAASDSTTITASANTASANTASANTASANTASANTLPELRPRGPLQRRAHRPGPRGAWLQRVVGPGYPGRSELYTGHRAGPDVREVRAGALVGGLRGVELGAGRGEGRRRSAACSWPRASRT